MLPDFLKLFSPGCCSHKVWRKQEANFMGILLQPDDFFKIGSCLVPPNRNSLWEAVSSPFASQTNLPQNPQICIWGWVGGEREGGFKTFSCAQRAYSLPLLISFWPVYHADLFGFVLICFSENMVLVSAAVGIAKSIQPNSPLPSGFPM